MTGVQLLQLLLLWGNFGLGVGTAAFLIALVLRFWDRRGWLGPHGPR